MGALQIVNDGVEIVPTPHPQLCSVVLVVFHGNGVGAAASHACTYVRAHVCPCGENDLGFEIQILEDEGGGRMSHTDESY